MDIGVVLTDDINRLIGLVGRVFANGLGDLVQSQVESCQRL